jgi:hypothetical protein
LAASARKEKKKKEEEGLCKAEKAMGERNNTYQIAAWLLQSQTERGRKGSGTVRLLIQSLERMRDETTTANTRSNGRIKERKQCNSEPL